MRVFTYELVCVQAFAELYCRKIEVYNSSQPDAAPQDYMWHGVGGATDATGGEGSTNSGGTGNASSAGAATPSAAPFAEAAAQSTPRPIRLSYHNGNHYNSVEDLDHTTYLDALGLPGQSGGVEKQNISGAPPELAS